MAGAGPNSSKIDKNTKSNISNNRKRCNESVTQNPAKRGAKRKRSEDTIVNPKQEKDVNIEGGGKDAFSLLISNIPFEWSYDQITDYINENCVDVYTVEQLSGGDFDTGQKVQLTFTNFEQCNKVRKLLKLKTIDGKKLDVVYKIPGESDSDDELGVPLADRRNSVQQRPVTWESIDIWATEPTGTYGLKPSYLESLGIKLPIDKWIHVSNFRSDKSELKEVLELAGQVVICRVVCGIHKYATAMYSHPLEAVQAVAMLNGQTFYGQVLKVSMYRCEENDSLLPKGLVNVGPGFGINGKPLRDIVQHYERYLNGKVNCINETIFNISNDSDLNEDNEQDENNTEVIDANENNDTITIIDNANNVTNEPGPSGNAIPKKANISITITQNLRPPEGMGPSSVPVHPNGTPNVTVTQFAQPINQLENTSYRPINQSGYNPGYGQNMMAPRLPIGNQETRQFGPYQGPRPVPPGSWGGPSCPPPNRNVRLPRKTSSVVELSNLPLSTTFPILSEKMALVGQVISLELTRVGCALVRFATPAHAERCYYNSNRSSHGSALSGTLESECKTRIE